MNLAGDKKLFVTLPNLKLYSYHLLDKVYTKDASNLPFISWPDGTPCTPANMYMLVLRDTPNKRGGLLSRRNNKGGTIGDYAAKISQIIRFCYQINKNFLDLNDSDFTNFMSNLKTQRYKNNIRQRQKNSESVNKTGQVCLKFLQFLGNFTKQPNFVAPNGTINISYRWSSHQGKNGQIYKIDTIHHHSFSVGGDPENPRDPISDHSINALKNAIDASNTSRFVSSRRHLHLLFLEHVGPRRGELAELTVSSINTAFSMDEPMLKMITLKKGVPATRLVPVSKMLLREARKHIKLYRSTIIKKFTKTGRADHDFLFISETTGKPLADTTITNEVNTLANLSGISEKACPHMFRHAFCTNLFVTLFERHKFRSDSEFEIRLMSDEAFLGEVLQYTGQGSVESLRTYIKSAYSRINKIPETVSIVKLLMLYQEYDSHILQLLRELENGLSVQKYSEQMRELINLKDQDIANSRKGVDG
jgi:integrase